MLRFEESRLVFYKDIERCPHISTDHQFEKWNRDNDKRLKLIALERYLMIFDYLRKTNQYLKK